MSNLTTNGCTFKQYNNKYIGVSLDKNSWRGDNQEILRNLRELCDCIEGEEVKCC